MVSAQTRTPIVLEGRVLDQSSGEPVPFASVGIEGYPIGTSSNADGYFSLKVPASLTGRKFSFKVSCVGFENHVAESPSGFQEIRLVPSRIQLKELWVVDGDLRPERIVQRAFKSIPKNYHTRPFVYKTFYRHYCKDDSVYGRLIEAAVDIYKRKGHRTPQPSPGTKDEVRVTQLRRSFDHTNASAYHAPIALYSVMGPDPVSYQARAETILPVQEVSQVRKYFKRYVFQFDGITEFDGERVYKITYQSKKDSNILNSGVLFPNNQTGTLFITADDYAIVKSEWSRNSGFDSIRTFSIYNKYNNKYYLHHTMKEGWTFNKQANYRHTYHLDLITSEIVTKNFEKFRGKEPSKEILFSVPYDSNFWNSYNILKASPLEEKIVSDLGGSKTLAKEYADYDSLELSEFLSQREGEAAFNKFREFSAGNRILYLDFWASWCGPCIREMMFEKRLLTKYNGKITFVLLSIDKDQEAWKDAIRKYKLNRPGFQHYRIGPESDATLFFEVNEIPRYILINKKGEFYNLNAKRPSDPELEKDFELLIQESEKK